MVKEKTKSSLHKESPSEKHILPALLSFFVPALGQFVKGQVKWGLKLWLWFILGNFLIGVPIGFLSYSYLLVGGAPSHHYLLVGLLLILVGFNLFMWVYQIYDAYNAPG